MMRLHVPSMIWVLLSVVTASAQPVPLVRDGESDFAIYHDSQSPSSVTMAAAELQTYLYKVTGAKLTIVHKPRVPMICLGDNVALRAAGLSARNVPLEGYRITTKAGSIFIQGPDTNDGQQTAGGGTSTGTRNGVYAFIERFLGVRWLVPGPHGDYIPTATTVTIPDTDLSDAPAFLNRRVPYTQQGRSEVKRWWSRQRLGWSLYLNHSHNWRATIPAKHFDDHPDWFPERGGVRVPPSGRYKLCTTNPELVRAYADAAVSYFDRHSTATCFSLSPSDSAGYCECENCSALYEVDPNGERSVTPAILTFYNNVAKLVARKYPDKQLAGYVYAAYVFPPSTPIPLEPNVFLAWAPSFDYGYTLFRPELRQQWENLLDQWTQTTRSISYYDLPTHILTETGALNPPGLKILKFLYPRLKRANVKGVYVYGVEAWGRAAPLNYLLAKLAWNPDADLEALFDEFCDKAYGRGGRDINRLFRLLDDEVEQHFLKYPKARYRLTVDMERDIYAKNFEQIEQMYRSAESKVQDRDARARLHMVGDNLTMLHWRLRQSRLLSAEQESSFYLTDAEFFRFLSNNRGSLALQPTLATRTPSFAKKKWAVAATDKLSNAEAMTPFRLRGDQHAILVPTGGGPLQVRFSRISARGKLVTYSVFRPDGSAVESGLVSADVPIQLPADGGAYYHLAISAGSASFMIDVVRGAWAVDGAFDDQGLHFLSSATPVYFRVSEETKTFHLSLAATPPGETAVATLYAPDGSPVTDFGCERISVDRREITVPRGGAGWWKIRITTAPTGVLDDVWIKPGDELSGYFCLAPEQSLEMTPVASAP